VGCKGHGLGEQADGCIVLAQREGQVALLEAAGQQGEAAVRGAWVGRRLLGRPLEHAQLCSTIERDVGGNIGAKPIAC
jgi:hypothetical protein